MPQLPKKCMVWGSIANSRSQSNKHILDGTEIHTILKKVTTTEGCIALDLLFDSKFEHKRYNIACGSDR